MEYQEGKEVTYYKITENSISSSQETFIITNSSMARETDIPMHEEYKLLKARKEFNSHVNIFRNEVLEDMKIKKMNDLRDCQKRDHFLKKSEQMMDGLKKRRTDFLDKSSKFLVESIRQLKILNKDCQVIGNEVQEIRSELNMLLRNVEK